jgi:predicted nucleic acid-binding protein
MTFVLDASVALSWCFEDEATDETDALLRRLASEHAIVPALWELEVANVLVVARRRGRVTEAEATRFASILSSLPIEIERSPALLGELIDGATRHGLSAYDAAYLLLAARTGRPLATRDKTLVRAAADAGVGLVLPSA